jgi:hypothetical protein
MSAVETELDEKLEPDATPDVPLREPGEPADGKRPRAPSPRGRGRSKKPDSLEAPIREMLRGIGTVWHATEASRDHAPPTCGSVMVQQAPAIAKSLNAVAMDDPSVYRWLSSLVLMGGGWGAVAFATLPVVQAVVGRHVIPAIENRRYRGSHEADEIPFGEGEGENPEEPWSPPNEIA